MPAEFQDKVITETVKRRRGKNWLRLVHNGLKGTENIITECETALGVVLERESITHDSAVVNCPSEEIRDQLLSYDRGSFDGATLRVFPVQYDMSGNEIFRFVRGILEAKDEVRLLRNCYSGVPSEDKRITNAKGDGKKGWNSDPKEHQKTPPSPI